MATNEPDGSKLVSPEKFSGKAFFTMSFLFIMMLSVIMITVAITLTSPRSGIAWWAGFLLISVCGAMITVMAHQLFFFTINSGSLEIRNHVMPWYKKEYPFTAMDSVMIESATFRGYEKLSIKTVDLKIRGYVGGSLRTKHWLALGMALKKRHIRTKSEVLNQFNAAKRSAD